MRTYIKLTRENKFVKVYEQLIIVFSYIKKLCGSKRFFSRIVNGIESPVRYFACGWNILLKDLTLFLV